MGDAAYVIDSEQAEDIGHADTKLHIGHTAHRLGHITERLAALQGINIRGELGPGPVRRIGAVVGVGKHTVRDLGAELLAQLELAQQRNLTQDESVEVVVPDELRPAVRCELKVLHAGECALVQNIGGVAREQVKHGPWHPPYDGPGIEMHIRHSEGRNSELPVHIELRLEIAHVARAQTRYRSAQVDRHYREESVDESLVEVAPVDRLLF